MAPLLQLPLQLWYRVVTDLCMNISTYQEPGQRFSHASTYRVVTDLCMNISTLPPNCRRRRSVYLMQRSVSAINQAGKSFLLRHFLRAQLLCPCQFEIPLVDHMLHDAQRRIWIGRAKFDICFDIALEIFPLMA